MQHTNYLSLCTGITVSTRLHNIRVLIGINHTAMAVVMPEIFAFFFLADSDGSALLELLTNNNSERPWKDMGLEVAMP